MPELPEVETTIKGLNAKVLGRTFVDVWSDWEKTVKMPKHFLEFKKTIKGKTIKNIWRRSKSIIMDLSEGYSLLVHQKMTGHLLVGNWKLTGKEWKPVGEGPLNDPYNRFLHVIFFFDNKEMLALSDARKFAKIELWKKQELLTELEKMGPEPLSPEFNLKKFKEILKNKKGRIKEVLMNPEVIAGIGNIYANEALWHSKIHPEKNPLDLKDEELKLLYESIKKVLKLGIKLGGESFSDYRKVDGSKGNFDSEKEAYQREGEKCRRCLEKIIRKKLGGRSAFFCPNCQKL